MTDEDLARRAARGDRDALDELLRNHTPLVHGVCRRILGNADDALDATQEALLSIATKIGTFDGRARFTTWCYRIATNAALDEIRRTNRRPRPTDDSVLAATMSAGEDASGGLIDRLDLETALDKVTPEYRQVLVLRHVADLDYADIADTLGLPIGTVRSRLARGRAQLLDLLGNPDGAG